ncbi:MAG: hypothetical protein ACR2NA_12905 [Solirubrobacterales bacterium]
MRELIGISPARGRRFRSPARTLSAVFAACLIYGWAGLVPGAYATSVTPRSFEARAVHTSATPDTVLRSAADPSPAGSRAHGERVIDSLSGFSVNNNQRVVAVFGGPGGSVVTSFQCPQEVNRGGSYDFSSIEVRAGNKADVRFCPSVTRTYVAKPDLGRAADQLALQRYETDPLRQQQWGGRSLRINQFIICPDNPAGQDPRIWLSYSEASRVRVRFDGTNTETYCDESGQTYETVQLQKRRSGSKKWTRLGRDAVRLSGLREALLYDRSDDSGKRIYGGTTAQRRDRVTITDLPDVCRYRSNRNARMRVKFRSVYNGQDSNDFVETLKGDTDMGSGRKTYYSRSIQVCKQQKLEKYPGL